MLISGLRSIRTFAVQALQVSHEYDGPHRGVSFSVEPHVLHFTTAMAGPNPKKRVPNSAVKADPPQAGCSCVLLMFFSAPG